MQITITVDQLHAKNACKDGMKWFATFAPSGSITVDWTSELQVGLVSTWGFHRWIGWAVRHTGIQPLAVIDLEVVKEREFGR